MRAVPGGKLELRVKGLPGLGSWLRMFWTHPSFIL